MLFNRYMENLKYQMIAFDLDGTLLDDGKRIPDACLRALRAAGEAGCLSLNQSGQMDAVRAACEEPWLHERYIREDEV